MCPSLFVNVVQLCLKGHVSVCVYSWSFNFLFIYYDRLQFLLLYLWKFWAVFCNEFYQDLVWGHCYQNAFLLLWESVEYLLSIYLNCLQGQREESYLHIEQRVSCLGRLIGRYWIQLNEIGNKMEPCGTPKQTVFLDGIIIRMLTDCLRMDRINSCPFHDFTFCYAGWENHTMWIDLLTFCLCQKIVCNFQ